MIYRTYHFICNNCSYCGSFVGGISQARSKGWAVGRDRNTCYCPECAHRFRNVGRSGKSRFKFKII